MSEILMQFLCASSAHCRVNGNSSNLASLAQKSSIGMKMVGDFFDKLGTLIFRLDQKMKVSEYVSPSSYTTGIG